MLADEHLLLVERSNNEQVLRATLLHQAVSGVLDKKANALFKKTTEQLSIETSARESKD